MNTEQLISQIRALPDTQVHIRRADKGLGSVTIYRKLKNGIGADSIWLGRPCTEQYMQQYLQKRASEINA